MKRDSSPPELTPEPPKPAPERVGEIVVELQAILTRLRSGSTQARQLEYASCISLLSELDRLNRPPLPVRELKSLSREAGWHLRSLAGLAMTNVSEDAQHAAWALASLKQIARCVGIEDASAEAR